MLEGTLINNRETDEVCSSISNSKGLAIATPSVFFPLDPAFLSLWKPLTNPYKDVLIPFVCILQGSSLQNLAKDLIDANLHSGNGKEVWIMPNSSQCHFQVKQTCDLPPMVLLTSLVEPHGSGMQAKAKTVRTLIHDSLRARVSPLY